MNYLIFKVVVFTLLAFNVNQAVIAGNKLPLECKQCILFSYTEKYPIKKNEIKYLSLRTGETGSIYQSKKHIFNLNYIDNDIIFLNECGLNGRICTLEKIDLKKNTKIKIARGNKAKTFLNKVIYYGNTRETKNAETYPIFILDYTLPYSSSRKIGGGNSGFNFVYGNKKIYFITTHLYLSYFDLKLNRIKKLPLRQCIPVGWINKKNKLICFHEKLNSYYFYDVINKTLTSYKNKKLKNCIPISYLPNMHSILCHSLTNKRITRKRNFFPKKKYYIVDMNNKNKKFIFNGHITSVTEINP